MSSTPAGVDGVRAAGAKASAAGFRPVVLSLEELLGREYVDGVCAARGALTGQDPDALKATARQPVDFFPAAFQERLVSLLGTVGTQVAPAIEGTAHGATSDAFRANSKPAMSPLSGLGYYRVGEDGRLSIISKSEHYHVPLGHCFPGYALVERAKQLGVPNGTHNNTRGHITRLLEEELVRVAAGLGRGERSQRAAAPAHLNRVLNLETGSLAAEAAFKLLLARFYAVDGNASPKYAGRVPVFVVMGDDDGGIQANYHGTTVMTQLMRGMWPGLIDAMESSGMLVVRPVRPEAFDALDEVFRVYETPPYKIAGVFHELILMNYAARRLSHAFVERLYARAAAHDVPVVVDEIQTCIWSPEILMFKEYGVRPSVVVLGKGFPGGEYAASRVVYSEDLDVLPQFGALVTNGQEELASLAYLVTMRWAEENSDVTRAIGDHYEARLHELAAAYPTMIISIEGKRHLAGIFFAGSEPARQFVNSLQDHGLDISVQSYKGDCPPCALTKLPLIMGYEAVDMIVDRMQEALAAI